MKEVVPVKGLPQPKGVWSTVTRARAGQFVFVSGLLSKDENGNIVGVGDITAQTEQVIANLRTALAAAGATLEDIVRVDVYIKDMSHFDKIHAVRRKHFVKDPPASTMVEISRMTDDRCLIEINAIAVTQ